jgi:hypothetical protein
MSINLNSITPLTNFAHRRGQKFRFDLRTTEQVATTDNIFRYIAAAAIHPHPACAEAALETDLYTISAIHDPEIPDLRMQTIIWPGNRTLDIAFDVAVTPAALEPLRLAHLLASMGNDDDIDWDAFVIRDQRDRLIRNPHGLDISDFGFRARDDY